MCNRVLKVDLILICADPQVSRGSMLAIDKFSTCQRGPLSGHIESFANHRCANCTNSASRSPERKVTM